MIYDEDSNNNRIASSRSIVLLITQSCNLNCKYCYETYKNNEIMTIDVCKKILLHEFQKASKDGIWSHLAISYLGGEPLLNFDLIKEVSEWLWRQKWPLAYSLDIRTNGTLLSDEMVTWFSRNKSRIDVALSLDGLNETQIINRTDLHVDYGFFSKNWPHRRIKVVLFRDSLPILAKTVTEMLEKNLNIEFDIAAGISWTSADAEIFESQLEDLMPFADSYLDYTYFTKTEFGCEIGQDNMMRYIRETFENDSLVMEYLEQMDISAITKYYVAEGVLSGMRQDMTLSLSEGIVSASVISKVETICKDYGTTVVERPAME